jgi:hypothetical protein
VNCINFKVLKIQNFRVLQPDLMLAEATTCIKAIEEMMHPIRPLANQVAALATAIQAQTEQPHLLNANLLLVKRNQGGSRPLSNGHHHQDEDDNEEAFPTTHKMEFPKYDGTGDPLPWLNHCE